MNFLINPALLVRFAARIFIRFLVDQIKVFTRDIYYMEEKRNEEVHVFLFIEGENMHPNGFSFAVDKHAAPVV